MAGEESLGSGLKEAVKDALQVRRATDPFEPTSRRAHSACLPDNKILLDPSQHPIFVHCADGGPNTSALLGCVRRLQQWSFDSINAEARRFVYLASTVPESG